MRRKRILLIVVPLVALLGCGAWWLKVTIDHDRRSNEYALDYAEYEVTIGAALTNLCSTGVAPAVAHAEKLLVKWKPRGSFEGDLEFLKYFEKVPRHGALSPELADALLQRINQGRYSWGIQVNNEFVSYYECLWEVLTGWCGRRFSEAFFRQLSTSPDGQAMELLDAITAGRSPNGWGSNAVGARLRDLERQGQLFLCVPDRKWDEFAYRHGRIPIRSARTNFSDCSIVLRFETKDTQSEQTAKYSPLLGGGRTREITVVGGSSQATLTISSNNHVIWSRLFYESTSTPETISEGQVLQFGQGPAIYVDGRSFERVLSDARRTEAAVLKTAWGPLEKPNHYGGGPNQRLVQHQVGLLFGEAEAGPMKRLQELASSEPDKKHGKMAAAICRGDDPWLIEHKGK